MIQLKYLANIFKQRIPTKKNICSFKFEKFSNACNFVENDMHLIHSNDIALLQLMKTSLLIKENFLSEYEESNLLIEIEPVMKKRRYEFDHWDNVI